MKTLNKIMAVSVVLLSAIASAQIKNTKTETVKIFGNCGMCETKIEKAGNLKNIAKVDWDADTKIATLTYDEKKINQDQILKSIALAGYDSEKFLAPDDAYSKLPSCCQYDRAAKIPAKIDIATENQSNHENHTETTKVEAQEVNQLKATFDNYFAVKDALVKTDGNIASLKSKELVSAINAVKMDKLEMDVHMIWMKVITNLKEDAAHISETKDAKRQRDYFDTLSKNMYELIKVSKLETPTYYQFCPMANNGKGANWLSKDNTIKNPYYGSIMMSCGKTVETLK